MLLFLKIYKDTWEIFNMEDALSLLSVNIRHCHKTLNQLCILCKRCKRKGSSLLVLSYSHEFQRSCVLLRWGVTLLHRLTCVTFSSVSLFHSDRTSGSFGTRCPVLNFPIPFTKKGTLQISRVDGSPEFKVVFSN